MLRPPAVLTRVPMQAPMAARALWHLTALALAFAPAATFGPGFGAGMEHPNLWEAGTVAAVCWPMAVAIALIIDRRTTRLVTARQEEPDDFEDTELDFEHQ